MKKLGTLFGATVYIETEDNEVYELAVKHLAEMDKALMDKILKRDSNPPTL